MNSGPPAPSFTITINYNQREWCPCCSFYGTIFVFPGPSPVCLIMKWENQAVMNDWSSSCGGTTFNMLAFSNRRPLSNPA